MSFFYSNSYTFQQFSLHSFWKGYRTLIYRTALGFLTYFIYQTQWIVKNVCLNYVRFLKKKKFNDIYKYILRLFRLHLDAVSKLFKAVRGRQHPQLVDKRRTQQKSTFFKHFIFQLKIKFSQVCIINKINV